MTALAAWENFYVIVGSSAGALVGLQFVVMALIADMPVTQGVAEANDAFSTPTIVHFGSVLLLAAILSVPWRSAAGPGAACGVCGVAGMVYGFIVTRRMRSQPAYRPVFEDWLFHAILPILAYATLAASSIAAPRYLERALFGVAVAALLLLFIGIHNAWDSVTYLVFVRRKGEHDRRHKERSHQTDL